MCGATRSRRPGPATIRPPALYGAVGTGVDVSGGPMVFAERQEGAFARNVANDNYYDKGREITSTIVVDTGETNVVYTVGPYAG